MIVKYMQLTEEEVTVEVEAESKEEAKKKIQEGQGDCLDIDFIAVAEINTTDKHFSVVEEEEPTS
jgi:hypothetical protein